MAKIILEIEADPSGLAPAADAIKQLGKTAADLYTKLQAANAAYKQMAADAAASAAATATAQGNTNKTLADFSNALKEINKQVAAGVFSNMLKDLAAFGSSITNLVEQIKLLNTQQAEMAKLSQQMSAAGLEATDTFNNMATAAQNNKEQIKQVAKAVNNAATNLSGLELISKAMGDLTAAFKASEGAAEAFGVKSETLSNFVKTLEIIMAGLNAVIKINTVLEKDSAAVKLLSSIYTKAQSAATIIATTVFGAFNVSVNGTSIAFKVLRGAIMATGIGALVVLIGLAVNAIMDWVSSSNDAATAQADLAAEIDRTNAAMDRQTQVLDLQNQQLINNAKNALKIAKAKGNKDEIAKAEKILLEVDQKALDSSIALSKKNLQAKAKDLHMDIPANIDTKTIASKMSFISGLITVTQAQKDKLVSSKGDQTMIDKYTNDLKKLQDMFDGLGKLGQQLMDKDGKVADATSASTQTIIDNKENAAKASKKATEDIKNNLNKQFDNLETATKAKLTKEKEGSANSLTIMLDGLNQQLAFLNEHHLKMGLSNDEYLIKQADLQKQMDDLVAEHTKKRFDKELDDINTANEIKILAAEDGSANELTAKLSKLEDEKRILEAHKNDLGNQNNEYLLKLAQNADAIDKINKQIGDNAAQETAKKIADNNLEIELFGNNIDVKEQLLKKYQAAKEQNSNLDYQTFLKAEKAKLDFVQNAQGLKINLADEEAQWKALGYEGDYNEFMKWEQKKIDDQKAAIEKKKEEDKKAADEQKAFEQELAGAGIELATQSFGAIMEMQNAQRQANFDNAMSSLQKEKEAELSKKNLTEAQKEAINKKYADKEKALKKKKFEDDKKAKITEAIINAAVSVTKLIAQAPPPLNPAFYIGLGMIAATTGIQIAKIASQPTPQFAKGTRNAPPGFKWVGEQGPELINTPGGHAIITAPDSALISSVFDKYGLPALTVPSFNAANISSLITAQSGGSSLSFDYDQMGRSIAKHLPEGTKVNINMDKDGVHAYVTRSNARVNYNNNKFRFN